MKKRELKDDKEVESYWQEEAEFTPESRLETARVQEEMRKKHDEARGKQMFDEFNPAKRERRFFDQDGKPYSFNDPK